MQDEQLGYHLSNVEEWWQIVWNSGFRGLLPQLTPVQVEQFKDVHLTEVGAVANDTDIWLDVPAIFAVGHKLSADHHLPFPISASPYP